MFQGNLVPTIDPNPLPAPYWVFKLLLDVTFFLHIVAMNFMLGGTVMALLARTRKGEGARAFADIAKKLPLFLPATITLGIAPLLFVQVLYGQFFYTSSILIGWPWLLVLVFLAVAYYGFYYASFKAKTQTGRAGKVMLGSFVLVTLIGFIYSNNITLEQMPERWGAKYWHSMAGWNLNLSDPTLIPRFLHFFVAAVAVGGMLLVFLALANWERDREYARGLFWLGGKAFLYATMAQFVIGFWFLGMLPRPQRMLFMGGSPLVSALLGVGLAGGIVSIILMSRAVRQQKIGLAVWPVSIIMAVVILSMVILRDILRDSYLSPYFHPEEFAIRTQWSPFLLFLGLFIPGVALWLVMLYRFGLFGRAKEMAK